jgi:programmed cell death protein 5
MDELEEIRRRKLEELQRKQIQQQFQEDAQLRQQVEQLEQAVRQSLTKEALQRYGNLKTAHPEKAVQLLVILAQLIQGGAERIDDDMMKRILIRLAPQKKEFKLNRK